VSGQGGCTERAGMHAGGQEEGEQEQGETFLPQTGMKMGGLLRRFLLGSHRQGCPFPGSGWRKEAEGEDILLHSAGLSQS